MTNSTPKAFLLHVNYTVEVRVTKQHPQSLRHATRRRDPKAVIEHISAERIAALRTQSVDPLLELTKLGEELISTYDAAMQEAMM